MVDVFFATNRNPVSKADGWFGERFHDDGPMFFRVGSAAVDKVSNDPDDGYQVKSVTVFPEKLGADDQEVKKLLGSSKLLADLRKAMTKVLPSARVVEGDIFGAVGKGLTLEAAKRYGS